MKQVEIPNADYLDPAVRKLMQAILDKHVPWVRVDDAVRRWFYHPPQNPGIVTVRRNANKVGLDLVVGPFNLQRALLALEDRLWAR